MSEKKPEDTKGVDEGKLEEIAGGADRLDVDVDSMDFETRRTPGPKKDRVIPEN